VPEYISDARAVTWFRLPATPQNIPNIVCEPSPLRSLGPLGPSSPKDLCNSGVFAKEGKRYLTSQNLVYHHSKRIAIRRFRPTAVFETEFVRLEEFWAHPSGRTTPFV